MNLTNKYGLPEALVRAVKNDPYHKGQRADFSVTQLLRPPQLARLLATTTPEPQDVSEMIWALWGQATHAVLERASVGRAPEEIFEERFYARVNVDTMWYTISGQIDHYDGATLSDYKSTSVYARDGKQEWVEQLNLLRYLMVQNGYEPKALQNVLLFRDWRPKEALKEDYPKTPVLAVQAPLWPLEQAAEFLATKIREHTAPTPRPCTDDERWASGEKWALMKEGQKRAVQLFDTLPNITPIKGHRLEHRPGVFRRCESYCAVSSVCPQWKREQPNEPEVA